MCWEDLYVAMLLLYMLLITGCRSLNMFLELEALEGLIASYYMIFAPFFFPLLRGSRELWILMMLVDLWKILSEKKWTI